MTAVTSKPKRALARPPAAKGLSGADRLKQWNGDPTFMLSLARGLLALRVVADAARPVSIAEVAAATGLPRAAARRCVYTLIELGYLFLSDGGYGVGPSLVSLTSACISATPLLSGCQPILNRLRDRLREDVSLGTLEAGAVIYVARAVVERHWGLNLQIGSRLPAYCTAMGRVLLAFRPQAEIDAYLAETPRAKYTERTITATAELLDLLSEVRRQGYAIGDEELEIGLRGIAAPVRNRVGEVIAVLSIGAQAGKVGLRDLRSRVLPSLLDAAAELSTLSP